MVRKGHKATGSVLWPISAHPCEKCSLRYPRSSSLLLCPLMVRFGKYGTLRHIWATIITPGPPTCDPAMSVAHWPGLRHSRNHLNKHLIDDSATFNQYSLVSRGLHTLLLELSKSNTCVPDRIFKPRCSQRMHENRIRNAILQGFSSHRTY